MRRFRPVLFAFALILTSLALGSRARAAECSEGDRGWIDFGTCCWQYHVVQLLPGKCVDGFWEVDTTRNGYKCLFSDPC